MMERDDPAGCVSTGALYPDGTSKAKKMDDSVPPGGSYTYRWEVKPEFAPTKDDANCLTWVYHSHVDAPRDIASGLIGSLLICKKGMNERQHRTELSHSVLYYIRHQSRSTWS